MTLIIKLTGFDDYLGEDGAFIKALILGPPGAGKTRSSSFWPRAIVADCENGRMSIADRGVAYGDIRSGAAMDSLLDQLALECRKPIGDRRWQTFVVDTLDSYQRILIAERLESEQKASLSGWADWGYLDGKMSQFVEKLQNLSMHIVVNCHVKETTENQGEDQVVFVNPKLKGDIRDQIPAEFDLVGYMSTNWAAVGGERTLVRNIQWVPEPRYPILKDRSGRLPDKTKIDFTEDDFNRIYNSIVGEHMESMPKSRIVQRIDDVADAVVPAPPDVTGGAVAVPSDFKTHKNAKDPEPPPSGPPMIEHAETGDATPARTARTEPTSDATTTEPADVVETGARTDVPTHPEAIETVESIGGEVLSDTQPVDETPSEPAEKPAPQTAKEGVCGDQPPHMVGVKPPLPGCGKALADQAKTDLAVLKTGTWLCDSDYAEWKQAN